MLLSLLAATCLAQASERVTFIFGGDVIPHDPVKYVARQHALSSDAGSLNNEGWDHVLGPIAPALRRADFAVVNLETPIVTIKKPETGEMVFNAQPPLLGALKTAGVDVATFANNHCVDQHLDGIVSTRAFLADAGLLTAGADLDAERAWTPLVVEKSGLRVGLLAVTRWLNGFHNKKDPGKPHVPAVPYAIEPITGGLTVARFLEVVAARAQEVDALIVTIHWGAEYKFVPAPEDQKLAQQLIDVGAFAVIGHHPHVLQPVKLLDRPDGGVGLVAFSLGNLVSNQDFDNERGAKRDGLLLELALSRAGPDGGVRLESVLGVPVATENRLGLGKQRNVQAVLLDEELSAMELRLAELKDRTERPATQERRALEARRKVALERKARITGFLGPAAPPPLAGSSAPAPGQR